MSLRQHLGKTHASDHGIVTPDRMAQIDARTIAAGTSGQVLMERAGRAVVRVVRGKWARRSVAVLTGPGKNGGDGWGIARLLSAAGWPVNVYSDWGVDDLKGDALEAARLAKIRPRPLTAFAGNEALVVDALFGAGLTRPLSGAAQAALAEARWAQDVLAVDLPSGVEGRSGECLGEPCPATVTVTFHRPKPGHFLGAGRHLTGALHVADIGLIVANDDAIALHNHPDLWREQLPLPPTAAHKYARGGVMVVGGPRHQTGAARLSAEAAARAGAGAVFVITQAAAADIYAAHLTSIMTVVEKDPATIEAFARAKKVAATVIGPGIGVGDDAEGLLRSVMSAGQPGVYDADALTMIGQAGREMMALLPEEAVLTPHEGEFATLFPDVSGNAMDRCVAAAAQCGRTVLLKGATTIIATPGETPIMNTHASPYLATAGAGDVLSGLIAGLLAQGMSAHLAAAAGAWLHGDAAQRLGPGMTADDLPKRLPLALQALEKESEGN
ncbi:NAD(P)H-hydrate dehydratase [Parvularcula sp. LCG005]|uniref:NAD(P)H-hydrate dehydratase n=1 Tax=Parvularcula sp. LCG005 TaxID=3078805 RepID=UPI002942EE85|nr:NAD(P)H-hydrate dehydratase [Parvularcula sp. LCG005]WOI52307.1 NAD(P)H-hydrate dehydratase [Parvularcula sp. LCG005]